MGLGCGRVAQHYKKIFNSGEIKNFNIVGFCDILVDKSREFVQYFDSNSYEDYELMLTKEKPDLLIILTPSGFHYNHTKTAFEFNCNVLCEKPITMLPNEAEELQKLAAKKKTSCIVQHFKIDLTLLLRFWKKQLKMTDLEK